MIAFLKSSTVDRLPQGLVRAAAARPPCRLLSFSEFISSAL